MHLFIDESGNFVSSASQGSWSTVAAYVVPERARRTAEEALRQLKLSCGATATDEIKLRNLSEPQLQSFLKSLSRSEGLLFCVATDTGLYTKQDVVRHHKGQIEGVFVNIDRCRFDSMRSDIIELSKRLSALSPQLYLQFVCQYTLVADLLDRAMLHFVQRAPSALGHFRWRIDQKHKGVSAFEDSFKNLIAPLLQSYSLENPITSLIGADYSHFKRFDLKEGVPPYLMDECGVVVKDGFNIGKIMNEDFKFVDSKDCQGVQIVDLLASSLRRCLRGDFEDNLEIASLLGGLMTQQSKGPNGHRPPISLVTLGDEVVAPGYVFSVARSITRSARPMLAR